MSKGAMHSKREFISDDRSIKQRLARMLADVLGSVPIISNVNNGIGLGNLTHAVDFIAKIKLAGRAWEIAVAVKSNGQPRIARNAIALWEFSLHNKKPVNTYFVFAAPFVSLNAQAICKEAGAGFLDLAGNCYFAFDNIFVERIGRTVEPEKRRLRSLFYEKSSRVIRRLLNDPLHPWHVQELAEIASVSTGLVSQIKTKLIDGELAERRGDVFVLRKPDELLQQWGSAYQFSKNKQMQFYSTKSLAELDALVAKHCSNKHIDYAFTLFSGAGLIGAQYVRVVNRACAYVMCDSEILGQQLGLKRVDSGGNLLLLEPADPDLLIGKRKVRDRWVVSDIQLYLDFSSQKGRAQETADFILDSTIRKAWMAK